MSYIVVKMIALYYLLLTYVGYPKNLGSWIPSLKVGMFDPYDYALPEMCNCAKHGCSALDRLSICVGTPETSHP